MGAEYKKSGYLSEDFRLFHNADNLKREISFHYHDFHKLLLLMSGNISYLIEGKEYSLQPGDIVLVHAGQIHRPVIHDHSLYERIIFYISPRFFQEGYGQELNLFDEKYSESDRTIPNLLRLRGERAAYVHQLALQLKEASHDTAYASDLYRKIKLTELLILLKRAVQSHETDVIQELTANPLILSAISYIHSHLTEEELNIDEIARAVSVNRSYLMHLFKAQIGYTIGHYITEKRLYMAGTLIESGIPVTQACYQSGFKNYAAYHYARRHQSGDGSLID